MRKHFVDFETNEEYDIDYFLAVGPKRYCPIFVPVWEEDFEKVLEEYFKSDDCFSEEKPMSDNSIIIEYFVRRNEEYEYDFLIGFQVQYKLEGGQ